MHAHAFATQERTQAPPQMLRGVAGGCAPLAARGLRDSSFGEVGRVEKTAYPSTASWIGGSDRDFGSSAGGGLV
jgi:hypothetical protein